MAPVPDLKAARPVIRELVDLLQFRGTFGRPCYVKHSSTHAALIVPHLTDGADGPYSWARTFRRDTIHEARLLGYITLGPDLGPVPDHAGAHGAWYRSPDHYGRTITHATPARTTGDPA